MLFQIKDVANEFKRVEDLFQSEVPESETKPEANNGGYKAMLKGYMNIEETAFEVLYDEEAEQYRTNSQAYHLPYDDSRVDWGDTYERLQAIQ